MFRKLASHHPLRIIVWSVVCLFSYASVLAQTINQGARTTSATITAVAAADRVRITAPASIVQMRVEVYDGNGIKVWDNEIRGNVFDWYVQDGQAQRLVSGEYVCVVTVKNLAGRVSQRIGSLQVGEKDLRLGAVATARLSLPQTQAIGPMEEEASWTVLTEEQNQTTTVIAYDGTDGHIVRGRGAVSFRLGDFFSGKDKEQMRLSEEGNLGIGTATPEFKLDVAGAIRAREGFVFNDGSTLTVNEKGVLTRTASDGNITPNIAGTGTQGRLAKWTDNAGTLGDSVVSESSGNIGIGVANPGDLLDIAGAPNGSGRSGIHVRTTSSAGNSTLYFDNDRGNFAAYGGLITGGSANPFSFFGVTRADKTFLIADGPSSLGLGVGTIVAQPVIFGTNNVERMRISPTGNVGIGAPAPGFKLDVGGRTRLRQNSGDIGSLNTAGLWLFQNSPNADRAFIGMETDNSVGFFGNNGGGWAFVMDTQTGNIKFTGSISGRGTINWQTISGSSQQAEPNAGYLVTNSSEVTITLPTSPNIGDVIRVSGVGTGGWKITQNAGQSILGANIGLVGTFWTPRENNRPWRSVSSSADGVKLLAVVAGGQIYTSFDSGVSWTARESNRNWFSVGSSADGVKLVAVAGVFPPGDRIYTSTDSGVSWTPREAFRDWRTVASSADGVKLVAAVFNGQIFTSVDSGLSWTPRETNRQWWAVASSADGAKLVAVVNAGQIYTSTNSGVNWTPRETNRNWLSVASSADGSKLVAVVNGGQIYTSTDSGLTWTPRENTRNWAAVASSADGSKLVAVNGDGQIYTSSDSGATWIARESSRFWISVASSADGSKLVAATNNGQINNLGQIYTSSGSTTLGVAGFLRGGQHTSIELQYIGNGQFLPLSHAGTILGN